MATTTVPADVITSANASPNPDVPPEGSVQITLSIRTV
jgi:hypothetical protein